MADSVAPPLSLLTVSQSHGVSISETIHQAVTVLGSANIRADPHFAVYSNGVDTATFLFFSAQIRDAALEALGKSGFRVK